ncbi:hypothetical protein MKX01_027103 [Papaver californicum]|nr:hypothetical protein MKX01_027103 [Papaver californicum]
MIDVIGESLSVHHGRMFNLYVLRVLLIIGCAFFNLALPHWLPDVEVEALTKITKALGKQGWDFAKSDPCNATEGINCTCTFSRNTVCHITGIVPNGKSLVGILPPYSLDSNYLNGSSRNVWGSMKLVNISLFANRLSGPVPEDIGNITTLKNLLLSSNNFTGELPQTFSKLTNLTDLEILASGLEGPIPSEISTLEKLSILLRISDLKGENGPFPPLDKLKSLRMIILRSYNINGTLPTYFGIMKSDLSYNNFTLEDSNGKPKCLKSLVCDQLNRHSFNINCGGGEIFPMNGSNSVGNYDGDNTLSSSGDFMDNDDDSASFIAGIPKTSLLMADSELYMIARKSPISPTYYSFCLINGNYTVNLHFAEIEFQNDKLQVGRRVFDVYIQGKLKLKDFDIVKAAGGVRQAVIRTFNESVTSNTLEIRFYWAGKGTQRIPKAGFYGPLISAISVLSPGSIYVLFLLSIHPLSYVPSPYTQAQIYIVAACANFVSLRRGKSISVGAVAGIVVAALCLVFILGGALWWKGYLGRKNAIDQELRGLDLNTNSFTLRQIKAATNNFAAENKIGEGGFGPVYKEIVNINEIGMISGLRHPNLAKLYGCCIEANQLLLIYEYLPCPCIVQLKLDWPTRQKICIGIDRGLTYLHGESRLEIVHRHIKGTNVLLDKDLNPKISDFGLSKLDEEDDTHISTRIAGTRGYMAPEYALRGYLTDKADVYSFGVFALVIVSGKSNTSYRTKQECIYLLDWALVLQENGNLMELVDPKLESDFEEEEVLRIINIALMCTNTSPALRPKMASILSMLESRTPVGEFVSNLRSDSDSSTSAADLYPLINESEYWNNRY